MTAWPKDWDTTAMETERKRKKASIFLSLLSQNDSLWLWPRVAACMAEHGAAVKQAASYLRTKRSLAEVRQPFAKSAAKPARTNDLCRTKNKNKNKTNKTKKKVSVV